MVVKLTGEKARAVVRETGFIDYRTNQPVIVKLEAGGKLIRLKAKGSRNWYTVRIEDVWIMGARNKV